MRVMLCHDSQAAQLYYLKTLGSLLQHLHLFGQLPVPANFVIGIAARDVQLRLRGDGKSLVVNFSPVRLPSDHECIISECTP